MSQLGDAKAMARFDFFSESLSASPVAPGSALRDDDLKPELLSRNMRANLFPVEQV
jgi:hypothetical protein